MKTPKESVLLITGILDGMLSVYSPEQRYELVELLMGYCQNELDKLTPDEEGLVNPDHTVITGCWYRVNWTQRDHAPSEDIVQVAQHTHSKVTLQSCKPGKLRFLCDKAYFEACITENLGPDYAPDSSLPHQ